MSLQVWLPLNGDLHSQGLKPTKVINNGATLSSTGKLGKSYSFAAGNTIGLDAANINNHKYSPITCALWVCITQNDSTERYILGCWENGGCGFTLKSQKIGWSTYINGYKYCYTPEVVSLNTWHHICGVYNGTQMLLYLDGMLVDTTDIVGTITYHATCPWALGSNPGSTNFGTGNFVGKITDLRIYNHALSAQEVAEIAKGLVLHYKLNQPKKNLLTKGIINTNPFKSALAFYGSYEGKDGVIGVRSNTLYTKTNNGVNDIFTGIQWDGTRQYTISGDWRDDRTDGKNSNLYLRFHYTDGTRDNVISPTSNQGKWTHFKLTSTAGKSVDKMTATYNNAGVVYIANLKLEIGTVETEHNHFSYSTTNDASMLSGNFNLLLNTQAEQNGNSQTAHLLQYYYDKYATLPTGTYTFSFDIKSSNGTDSCYFSYANGSSTIVRIGQLSNIPTTYTHYTYTFTNSSTNSNNIFFTSYTGYGGSSSPNTNNTGYIYIKNVKLELGETETSWRLAETEENNEIIYDDSGYNNNGQVVGTLATTTIQPKYKYGAVFRNGAYIRKTDLIFTNAYWTVGCWFKKTTDSTSYELLFCLSKGNGADTNKKFGIYTHGTKMGYIGEKTSKDNVATFNIDNWHHACLVNNNGNFTGYLDGTSVITFTNSNCQTDCTDFVVGGRGAIEDATAIGAPFEGYICDVRVYGTAFTSDQIQDWYKDSMIIVNGALVARQLL